MTVDYLARLKNYESAEAGTAKTAKTTEGRGFVSFGSSAPGGFGKKQPPTSSTSELKIPECPDLQTDKTDETPACTREWLQSQGCAVMAADVDFIRRHLPRDRRAATLHAYVATWRAAMDREPLPHRKDNRGRFTANTALREGRLNG